MKQAWILLLLFTANAFAVCSSPISRSNSSANTVLTSTKYNTDINTVYTRINSLPGDCIVDASVTTDKIADDAVTEAKIADAVLARFIPVGTILPYAGTSAPTGFLLCNGQAVSRTTYADLYAVIGVSAGSGNGSTTFNIFDLRGRFLRGVDGGAGRDPDRLTRTAMATGGNSGDQVGSVQLDAFQNFTGSFVGTDDDQTSQSVRWKLATGAFATSSVGGSGTNASFGGGAGSTNNVLTLDPSTVARTSTETRPTNANVNFIIKY